MAFSYMKYLLYNGKVWAGKSNFSGAIGFDTDTGKIIFTGNCNEFLKKDYDKSVDLKGKIVLPAFTDGHVHLIAGALVNSHINFRYSKTRKDFSREINRYKKVLKSGDMIYGGYFSEANFTEKIVVDRDFLDSLCRNHPMFILRNDLHSCILNTKAIDMLEIKAGQFRQDEAPVNEKGDFTGEFSENAFTFIRKSVPQKPVTEKALILKNEIQSLYKYGIVAVSDITFTEDLEIYKYLLDKNELKLKIDSRLPYEEFPNRLRYESEFSDYQKWIKFKSFKAYYDGSLSSETAFFKANYKNKNHSGVRTDLAESGELAAYTHMICEKGYQPSIHAIGDKAVSEVIDIYNDVAWLNPDKTKMRYRIEHAQHIDPEDFEKFEKDRIIVSVQPAHLWFDSKIAEEKLTCSQHTHNYKKLADRGIKVCFGTDFPVVAENPFETIYYAMTRKIDGKPFYKENCFDLETCLEAYTYNNAYASSDENERGNLETGKAADIIVLDNDIFKMPADEIRDSGVIMTFLNGERVY